MGDGRSFNDTVAALSDAFSHDEITPAALSDLKQSLSAYVSKHRKNEPDAASRLQDELRNLYRDRVETFPKKLALFMTVLKHLRPAIVGENETVEWFNIAVKPFIHQPGAKRCSLEDAQDFVVGAMVYAEDAPDAREKSRTCARLAAILLDAYMARSTVTTVTSVEEQQQQQQQYIPLQRQGQAAQQLQSMLVAFGRKKAKDLFLAIDHYLLATETRFQALGLLAAFVEQQQAHLYLVVHTAVIEHLLKCLMNDTSTLVVSAALRCLIMLLPHIPSVVATQLPRLFLIYSRCLCWEKFSASSTKAQRDLVTDERVRRGSDSDLEDDEYEEADPTWSILHSVPNMPESSAPELLHYFTYLYGLYPLNFLTYVRKPRKYLKGIDFPGADDFDLDQAVIRSRTEQFQRVHLLHPALFNTTAEDELNDNRWLKAEPSEVIAECHGLYVGQQPVLASPGPPPPGKLPDLPNLPDLQSLGSQSQSDAGSPTLSRARAAVSGRESPTLLSLEDEKLPHTKTSSYASDVAQLQRELMLLRNELIFERYLKQQHVAAIGQLRRNHIKAVTIEAETATLINANRALQKRLGDANKFNEKMQKETQARRTHTKQSEEQLTAKIRSLKADLANQETTQRDLEQARKDCDRLRQLLAESEARELGKQGELESFETKDHEIERLRLEISELMEQIRTHREREPNIKTTQAEHEMTKQEMDSMKLLLKHRNQELDQSKRTYRVQLIELETRLEVAEMSSNSMGSTQHDRTQGVVQQLQSMLTKTRLELAETKTIYAELLEYYAEPEARSPETLIGVGNVERSMITPMHVREANSGSGYRSQDGSLGRYNRLSPPTPYYLEHAYDQVDKYGPQRGYPQVSHPVSGYPPVRPIRPDAYPQRLMNYSPLPRSDSRALSDTLSQAWTAPHSVIDSDYGGLEAPGMVREGSKSAFSMNSEDDRNSTASGSKVKVDSEVRVYGRGMLQNFFIVTFEQLMTR